MKRLLLGCLLVASLASPAQAGLALYQEESSKSVPAGGLKTVVIENARGRIELLPGSGNSIEVVAIKIAHGKDPADAKSLASSTSVALTRESGIVRLKVRYPEVRSHVNWFQFDIDWDSGEPRRRGVWVRLQVRVPAGLRAEARTASGDIVSNGLVVAQKLAAASGDVRVEGATASLEINTTSGDVVARALEGEVALHTVSGDVRISSTRRGARIQTTSGDVRVADADARVEITTVSGEIGVRDLAQGLACSTTSGDVSGRAVMRYAQVATSSGDVDIQLGGPVDSAEVSTAGGDVVLRLLANAACDLEARTASGEIAVQTDLRVRSVGRHLVAGVIRGGKAPVRLRTSSGDVQVLQEGATP